jgi:hypothetical protein
MKLLNDTVFDLIYFFLAIHFNHFVFLSFDVSSVSE